MLIYGKTGDSMFAVMSFQRRFQKPAVLLFLFAALASFYGLKFFFNASLHAVIVIMQIIEKL
jgi:hypothetical protein